VERKLLVGFLAALLAEHKSRETVGAPPLEWSRQTALAHCCSWNTLIIEEAIQVAFYLRNKFLNVGAFTVLGLVNC
jgi:hypothetical protein